MGYTDLPEEIRTYCEQNKIDKTGCILYNDELYHLFKFDYNKWEHIYTIWCCELKIDIKLDDQNLFCYSFSNDLDSYGRLYTSTMCLTNDKQYYLNNRQTKEVDWIKEKKECIDIMKNHLNRFKKLYTHYEFLNKKYKTAVKLNELEKDFTETK